MNIYYMSTRLRNGFITDLFGIHISAIAYRYKPSLTPSMGNSIVLSLFFFINTEPRSRTLDTQLFVSQSEIPSLQLDSYINTAEIVTFLKAEIDNAFTLWSLLVIVFTGKYYTNSNLKCSTKSGGRSLYGGTSCFFNS